MQYRKSFADRETTQNDVILLSALRSQLATVQGIYSVMFSHWQKSQVRRFSDCCSADFGPPLPANQLYKNQNIYDLETYCTYVEGIYVSSSLFYPFMTKPGCS